MMNDISTVIWKEWRELIARSTQSRGETFKTIAVVGVILGLLVWRASAFLSNPAAVVVPSFVLVQFLAVMMADSFAGERERHTLETLLASRLSDLAILIGKIIAGVFLVWALIALTLILGVLGPHASSDGRAQLSMENIGVLLVMYLLMFLVVSCAAVLVSLRAATVRQAMQTLSWSFMGVFFLAFFAIARLSPEWRATLLRALAGENLVRTEIIAATVLVGLTLFLFGAARLRFQRSRLILD